MSAAQEGDSWCYEQLLRAQLPPLRGFVQNRLRDPASVEDVVQNVLLSIHRARHTYRPELPFGPWLWTIARNAVTDAQRSRLTRGRHEVAWADLEEVADSSPSAEESPSLSPVLVRALESLPISQREAVELIHLQQLSVAEAAMQVGITPGALKVRAHRGYRALRDRLGGAPR